MQRRKLWLWIAALVPVLVVLGLLTGALGTSMGPASLAITMPLILVVGIVFGRAMARSVFGKRRI